jgi:hypothetical protein
LQKQLIYFVQQREIDSSFREREKTAEIDNNCIAGSWLYFVHSQATLKFFHLFTLQNIETTLCAALRRE